MTDLTDKAKLVSAYVPNIMTLSLRTSWDCMVRMLMCSLLCTWIRIVCDPRWISEVNNHSLDYVFTKLSLQLSNNVRKNLSLWPLYFETLGWHDLCTIETLSWHNLCIFETLSWHNLCTFETLSWHDLVLLKLSWDDLKPWVGTSFETLSWHNVWTEFFHVIWNYDLVQAFETLSLHLIILSHLDCINHQFSVFPHTVALWNNLPSGTRNWLINNIQLFIIAIHVSVHRQN